MSELPELLTPDEAIAYLGLDREGGDARERLRNLMRRQKLPHSKRGRLLRFRRSEIEAWLDGENKGHKRNSPARQLGT